MLNQWVGHISHKNFEGVFDLEPLTTNLLKLEPDHIFNLNHMESKVSHVQFR